MDMDMGMDSCSRPHVTELVVARVQHLHRLDRQRMVAAVRVQLHGELPIALEQRAPVGHVERARVRESVESNTMPHVLKLFGLRGDFHMQRML